MSDEVVETGGTFVTTLLLALVVFAVGAAAGFLARLLWPNAH
jgi:hypothetical protein